MNDKVVNTDISGVISTEEKKKKKDPKPSKAEAKTTEEVIDDCVKVGLNNLLLPKLKEQPKPVIVDYGFGVTDGPVLKDLLGPVPDSEPKLIIAGKEIQLTLTEKKTNFFPTINPSRGFPKQQWTGQMYEHFKEVIKTDPYYRHARVSGIDFYLTKGSRVEITSPLRTWDAPEQITPYREFRAIGSVIQLSHLSLVGKVSFENTIFKMTDEHNNVFLEDSEFTNSKILLAAGGCTVISSTIGNTRIETPHLMLKKAELNNSDMVADRVDVENCYMFKTEIWNRGSRIHIKNARVSKLNVSLFDQQIPISITHRAHYGTLNGLNDVTFVRLKDEFGPRYNEPERMAVGKLMVTLEDAIKPDAYMPTTFCAQQQGLPLLNDNMTKFVESIFNPLLVKPIDDYEDQMSQVKPLYQMNTNRQQPFIQAQLVSLAQQVSSRLLLWNTLEVLTPR